MQHKEDFDESLGFGQDGEYEVASHYEDYGWEVVEYNHDSAYDIEMTRGDDRIFVEVKCDRRANETGNFFIEYYSRGKDSGIATSEADIWVLTVYATGEHLAITKEDLLEMCKGAKSVAGGDHNTSRGYLVKVHKVRENTKARDYIRGIENGDD